MSYLPDVYASFRAEYPEVAAAVDGVGAAVDQAGTLDAKTMRLVKLTMAIGAGAEGAVRSNVRKTRSEGVTPEEIRPAGLAAITTTGFSAAVAGLGSIDQAFGLERESQTSWSGPLLGNADESDGDDFYEATIGPFSPTAIGSVKVVALDDRGNAAGASVNLTVAACT